MKSSDRGGRVFRWLVRAGVAAPIVVGPSVRGTPAGPVDVDEFTARSIARIALMDLRMAQEVTTEDYRAAGALLGVAQQLQPEDAELLRHRIEAAAGCGDTDAVRELTRRLVELDPSDTVAQLRLITDRIQRYQNADDRLAAYERFLGPEGEGLDPAIRSRLALDAALLSRELGDTDGFVERLSQATRLDITNKEAAALALAYFSGVVRDPVARLDLVSNLLMSDPVDPNVHLTIARELAAGGAFAGAKRFHDSALRLFSSSGQRASDLLAYQSLVMTWHTEGPAKVAEDLRLVVDRQRASAASEIRMTGLMGRIKADNESLPDVSTLKQPKDINLPLELQQLHVLAALASGDEQATARSLVDFQLTINSYIEQLQDPAKRPKELTPEQARRDLTALGVQSALMRLWTNIRIDEVWDVLDRATESEDVDEQTRQILRGWITLRRGDAAAAIELLRPYLGKQLQANLGTLMAKEDLGETAEAIEGYRRVLAADPLGFGGAWAHWRLATLGVTPEQMTPYTTAMNRFAEGVPDWLDRMTRDPRRIAQLRAEAVDLTPGGLDRSGVRVELRNVSPIPLALGPDRALNSRLLVAVRASIGNRDFLEKLPPEIVDIDRRLRLMPRESLTVEVWPDPGMNGWLMEGNATTTVRLSWSVLQGFLITQQGGYALGPMGQTAQTRNAVRSPLERAMWSADELAAALGTRMNLAETCGAVRARLLASEGSGHWPAPEERVKLAEAAAAAYPAMDKTHRMLMAAVLPHAGQSAEMEVFDAATKAEEDPDVLCIVIASRVRRADEPVLAAAAESDDARLAGLAAVVRHRLSGGAPCFALMQRRQTTEGGG